MVELWVETAALLVDLVEVRIFEAAALLVDLVEVRIEDAAWLADLVEVRSGIAEWRLSGLAPSLRRPSAVVASCPWSARSVAEAG